MSLLQALTSRMAGTKTYVDDVFSAWVYTGTGASQTITNGIDLAGQGGLVWGKCRDTGYNHTLIDTVRGVGVTLQSNSTNGSATYANLLTAFNSNGFTLGNGTSNGDLNESGRTQASWTFRKAPKFFDVQTATLASGNATVSFTDLATLGMVIVKRTDSTGSWYVWHRSLTAGNLLYLEQTAAEATLGHITVSGTTLTLVDGVLADGDYVCYGFAHDTTTDGIIQCGSFTTDVSGNATVNLGWEPQYVLVKCTSNTNNWVMLDTLRGWANSDGNDPILNANLSNAEITGSGNFGHPTATGFTTTQVHGNSPYIYLAIRRPNKPPTLGTQVYNAIARTGTGAAATVTGVGFAPDLDITKCRSNAAYSPAWEDRLRWATKHLLSDGTNAEGTIAESVKSFDMDGVTFGTSTTWNSNTETYINHFFRRAPGVMDQVCYTGNAVVGRNVDHGLMAVPELMIVKSRTDARGWFVYHKDIGNTYGLKLELTDAKDVGFARWNSTTPTASVFTLGGDFDENYTGKNYVAYLFATLAGISKVGSYTGNGSNQTINCGFTTGARFILIKRTDSTGDWFVWDSVRGIVAGNDPHLSLNTTAAEVTTDDSIDPDTSGFIVNQVAATDINVTSASYIFLSFA